MNTAVSTRRGAAIALHEEFDKRSAEFAAILPQDVSLPEFKRVTLQAIAMNPRLLECTQVSVFRALTDAARNGWVPDGRDCYIDIRESFKTKELSAVCIPGKHGYLKNFIGKTLKDWRAHVVRRGDDYDVELGDNEHFTHKVDPFSEGGSDDDIIGAYSIAIGMDGRVISREFMSLAQILKARAKSSSFNGSKPQYSPWSTHFEEMCEKTVMKRHADKLPKEAKASAILAAEREIETENVKLLAEPKKPQRKIANKQTKQLKDLGEDSNAERDGQWNGDGGSTQNGQEDRQNAQSAENRTTGTDGSRTNAESSKVTSDASPAQQRRGPGRPRKEEAQQKTQQPEERPQTQAKANGNGDPVEDAREAGNAAYEAGIPRTGFPREYQNEDQWDLMDAWLEGWDLAADDSAGRALS